MPSTALELLLVFVFSTPGAIYLLKFEAHNAASQLSAVRETALLLIASVIAVGLSSATLLIASKLPLLADKSVDIEELIDAPGVYFRANPARTSAWFVALILLAWVLAFICPISSRGYIVPFLKGPIDHRSNWARVFEPGPETQIYLEVSLVDGSFVTGYLTNFNPSMDEVQHRDLVLGGPMYSKTDRSSDYKPKAVGAVIVSASEVRMISVEYRSKDSEADELERFKKDLKAS